MTESLANKLDKLTYLVNCMQNELNAAQNISFEEQQIKLLLEYLMEQSSDTLGQIEYFQKPSKTSYLRELANKRFSIANRELTCGSSLELYSPTDKKWHVGRVEYHNTYYFYCSELGHPILYPGMLARFR